MPRRAASLLYAATAIQDAPILRYYHYTERRRDMPLFYAIMLTLRITREMRRREARALMPRHDITR